MSTNGTRNHVDLIGRVGQDPKTHTFEDGSIAARFSLATSESWTTDTGAKQDKTQWHPVVAYGRTAELARDFGRKGDLVSVFGQLEHREFEKEGVKQRTSEIVLRGPKAEIGFLNSKREPA